MLPHEMPTVHFQRLGDDGYTLHRICSAIGRATAACQAFSTRARLRGHSYLLDMLRTVSIGIRVTEGPSLGNQSLNLLPPPPSFHLRALIAFHTQRTSILTRSSTRWQPNLAVTAGMPYLQQRSIMRKKAIHPSSSRSMLPPPPTLMPTICPRATSPRPTSLEQWWPLALLLPA
jgi:hypothetical protein